METFLGWLLSAAGAGWTVAFIALAALAYDLIRRRRPNKILVRELRRMSLITVPRQIRNAITVQYKGTPVERLSHWEAEISNQGSEVVSDIELKIEFPEQTRVIATSETNTPKTLEVSSDFLGFQASVNIPYLNPNREHGDTVNFAVLCDGFPEPASVTGGGEGWSVKKIPLPTQKEIRRRFMVEWGLGLVFVVALAVFIVWGTNNFQENGGKALVAAALASILFLSRFSQQFFFESGD